MAEDELLTVDEVAKILKVSKMTVYRYVSTKKLAAYKLEQELRIRRSDLNKYLKNKKV